MLPALEAVLAGRDRRAEDAREERAAAGARTIAD